ncbi:MAG: GDYXXLXY domain-containing protein [Kiloniellales bacterium]
MRLALGLVAIAVLQSAVLVAMIGVKQWTLATGTPVLLETEPVDPRSLFRGDYVRLNYAIGRLEPGELDDQASEIEFEYGDTVYVLLRKGEPYWEPVSIHRERPPASPDHVAIKGEVVPTWGRWTPISIRYGIENYFIPEGEGRELERPTQGEEVSVLVAVDRFGNAGIKAVLVNGEPRYVETLF